METYINGMACISHYNTIDEDFFFQTTPQILSSRTVAITAPEYKNYIPANALRRLSHILKMGISAALICLERAKKTHPDAIIVGTGMGCFEDTDKFLRSLIDNDERLLTPTSFIQSTHNTVAGQIALLTKCNGYNFTYVHQNLSFENALLDALMLLAENEAESVLVGGIDEVSDALKELLDYAGHVKKSEHLHEPIWNSGQNGHTIGEGAGFFELSKTKTAISIAKIRGVKTLHKVENVGDLSLKVNAFLNDCKLNKKDIDLVLSGIGGDHKHDRLLNEYSVEQSLPTIYFKNVCGEYFTASAFALWLAARVISKNEIPSCINPKAYQPKNIQNILIVNQYCNQHYSLMCVSQC